MSTDRPTHGPTFNPDETVTFRLWAPRASDPRLVMHDRELAMGAQPRGWWSVTIAAAHGDRYGFSVDGGPVRPDPAARRLPDGVHGLAVLVDPRRLGAQPVPEGWRAMSLLDGAVYELHLGTFTSAGTFDAAIEHLPALVEIGITQVEVMPVNAFNGIRGWGYDGVAWYAVHEPYGGPAGFARFVEACHGLGLAVVLDVVHNHLGPSGNYLPDFGPYLSEGTGTWGAGLNLDGPQSDPVRDFVIGSAVAWFRDYGIDALRLDAVHALHDDSATHILTELAMAVDALAGGLARPLELIAESDRNDPKTVQPVHVGGNGMTAQWADELHHAVHVALTGERDGYYVDVDGLGDLARAYTQGFVYDGTRYSKYRQRTIGAPLGDVDGRRLVACIQNHDQVGNRAAGERLTTLVDADRLRVGALLLVAAPHTPMLFMGEEHGATTPFQYFTSHPEPELAEAVRTGRAQEFASFGSFAGDVPDPQAPGTFEASTLDWSQATTADGRAWRALWTDLLRLRRETPALRNGRRDLVEVLRADPRVLAVVRGDEDGSSVVVVGNLTDEAVEVAVRAGAVLLHTDDQRYGGQGRAVESADGRLIVPARSGAVVAYG
jgi:maltooligosyltrehalose trehalohydrolase